MFLEGREWATGGGQQRAVGPFLLLFAERPGGEVRALVRRARLAQFGHFMMGDVVVGFHKVTISGTYGADGLTIDPARYPGVWERLHPLPRHLTELFWRGGQPGHNSAGSEGPLLRAWGRRHRRVLTRAPKVPAAPLL